ncbi:hypothetical protein [Nitrosovibrio sp. Nv17]|uniref:hypothetical protein n=1 Tax=Nitrosovibrio sp. Nv17 TaxID=1855339 RepID=UPI0009085DA8|nr:hypothetical protein [Nitrosovibrio sp. Nv17]SFW26689.1 hypothetical protein SAMN05216414_1107 [Nitrosovibrio sp. Nv17]
MTIPKKRNSGWKLPSRVFILAAFVLELSACSFGKPYATGMGSLDEKSAQTAARILLSPPQVFTRERLINDRLKEESFLLDQLEKSKEEKLGWNLTRNLETLSALSGQMSLSVNPVSKFNFENQAQKANLQQQIEVTQLQGQLLNVQNQLKALQAGTGTGPSTPANAPATTVTPGTDNLNVDGELYKRLDKLIEAISSKGVLLGPSTDLPTGTLEDEFEDRLALRVRIREAINANSLDDVHDKDGNVLYRLQFTATILPGGKKGQFGVARLTIEPPKLKPKDIKWLYHTWLSAVTSRMNQEKGGDKSADDKGLIYEVLGPMTGLYDVATLRLPLEGQDKEKHTFKVAVYPGHKSHFEITDHERHYELMVIHEIFHKLEKEGRLNECLQKKLENCLKEIEKSDLYKRISQEIIKFPTEIKLRNIDAMVMEKFIEHVLKIAPSVEAAIFALGDRGHVTGDVRRVAQEELSIYMKTYTSAKWILEKVEEGKETPVPGTTSDACDASDKVKAEIPRGFMKGLGLNEGKHGCIEIKSDSWRAYPYGIDPVLRSQRMSTLASAANALDLAMAVSAQVPSIPLSLGGSAGYSQLAAARVDAMERVPRVFGFAGPGDDEDDSDSGCRDGAVCKYEFGWIFGPKLMLDPKGHKLSLRQDARTEKVSVDISVPGWWPGATLKVQTAWKGRFVGGGGILKGEGDNAHKEYELPIRFRSNLSSFDALTVKLAEELTAQGFHQARIDMVRPASIPLCKAPSVKDLTVLIYGMDLWRNPRVFFGGRMVKSESVSVLPDMAGLSVVIDISSLPREVLLRSDKKDRTLVVWTSHGNAEIPLEVHEGCEKNPSASSQTHALQLSSGVETIASNAEGKGDLRIQIVPAVGVSSVDISATGGEIIKASSSPGVSSELAGNSVKVANLEKISKDKKTISVDLALRNLIPGRTLKITAAPKATNESKVDPVSLNVSVVPTQ